MPRSPRLLKRFSRSKVMGGDASGDKIKLQVEAAKGGKEETVSRIRLLEQKMLMYSCSLMQMLYSLLLVADHILPAWA
jgi:hypothetical protein